MKGRCLITMAILEKWAGYIRLTAFLGFFGLAWGNLPAQSAEAPPKPPFLAETAPASSRWTIDFKYQAGPGDAAVPTAPGLQAKRIVKAEVSKTGETKLERSSYDGGAVQDVWSKSGLMVLKDPDYAHKIVRRKAPAGGDFPELAWVNTAEFKGRERVGEKECHIFQAEFYPLQFSDPGLYAAEMSQENRTLDLGQKIPVQAYVDVKTKLPVKLVLGKDERLYTFLPAPSVPLSMPADYAGAIAEVDARYRALVKPLARP
jgi:hypothetical protein